TSVGWPLYVAYTNEAIVTFHLRRHTPTTEEIRFRQTWQGREVTIVDRGEYRSLYFDSPLIQSRMDLNHPLRVVSPYIQHMLAALLFNMHPRQVLLIGLGGGTLAKFVLHYLPACHLEAVDCHPAMASIAHQFFFLPTEDRLTLHCAEGEAFVAKRVGQPVPYDWILVDAFDHAGLVEQVRSAAFLSQLGSLLSDDGVLIFNLFRSQADLHQATLRTLVASFPKTILRLPVPGSNEIIFCLQRKNPFTQLKYLPELQRMTQQWAADQPDLTYTHFMGFLHRLMPVKQTLSLSRPGCLQHYPLRGKINFHLDLGGEVRVF
ncbi:MAG: hypothetical protein H7836_02610, partial [Magnetococcus sp. YQC-3]